MTRFPIVVMLLAALAVPTVASTAPGDGVGRERLEELRNRRGGEAAARNEQRFLDGLAVHDPERHRKVVEIRASRPIMYRQLLRQSGQELRMRNTDPESWGRLERVIDTTYALKQQLDAYETGSDKERAKLQPQVEETVGTLFELRQEQRKAQLREMEAKLERLRSDIEARDARKDQLVDDFTTRLLRAVERGGER